MKKFTFALMLVMLFAVACDKAEAPAEATAEQPTAEKQAELVEVSAEGSTFAPAIEKASIPQGSWICDMGTVHYARTEQGDGTCPLCKMKLVQYSAPGAATVAAGEKAGCDCAGCAEKMAKADGEHNCGEGGCEGCEHGAKKAEGEGAADHDHDDHHGHAH
ncbi:MAG: hypothetical protein H0U74_19550 [Bradymonadaceae bacterium]|nr:hypothetical protein [Lujinxingiaceae bacterium]